MADLDIGLTRQHTASSGLPDPRHDVDFVAIDFETANTSRASACSVGVSLVVDGRVLAGGSTLIDPEVEFSPYNVAINGIGPADVAGAPSFPEIWPHLAALLAGRLVTAHVATFDLGVLRQAVARYELDGIELDAVCSWRVARLAWPTLPAFGLSYLGQHLGLGFDHHQAGEDARACAEVLLSAEREHQAHTLRDLCTALGLAHVGHLTPDSFRGVSFGDLRDLTGADDADPDHPLYGRRVCFTGAMFSMARREAAERIVEFGADFKKNMSGEVDLLVIGDADFVQFADGLQTGKMKKAAQLKADGFDVEILCERDFLALLNS
jgi:DNA polymerase III subunit epsilon